MIALSVVLKSKCCQRFKGILTYVAEDTKTSGLFERPLSFHSSEPQEIKFKLDDF